MTTLQSEPTLGVQLLGGRVAGEELRRKQSQIGAIVERRTRVRLKANCYSYKLQIYLLRISLRFHIEEKSL